MTSRRQEKVAKLIRATVSSVIQNQLSDPRIEGLISVTEVELTPDFRRARVQLSMLGIDETKQRRALAAIRHAHGFIQARLAAALTMKTCPSLDFQLDDSLKKTSAVLRLIDEVAPARDTIDESPAEDEDDDAAEDEETES